MAVILIADDSAYARRITRKTLEHAGHTVLEAHGGMAAIESYYLQRPAIVLLDLTMEDLAGIDVLRKLREIDHDARVVIISADVQASTESLVLEAGALKFLGKPVAPETLLAVVDEVLSKVLK